MDYQEKYLKYKNKYLTLKNQMIGGGKDDATYHLTNCNEVNKKLNVKRNGISSDGTYNVMPSNVEIKYGINNLNMSKDFYNNIDLDENGKCRRLVKPDDSCKNAFKKTFEIYDENNIFNDDAKFNEACKNKFKDRFGTGEEHIEPASGIDPVERYQLEMRAKMLTGLQK